MFKKISLSRIFFFSGLSFLFFTFAFGFLSLGFAEGETPPEMDLVSHEENSSPAPLTLQMYHGAECPHCHQQLAWLPTLKIMYPDLKIETFEVWHNEANRTQMKERLKALGKESGSVPTNIIGDDEVIIGFGKTKILEAVQNYYGDPVLSEAEAQKLADEQKPAREAQAKAEKEKQQSGKKKTFGFIAGGVLISVLAFMVWSNRKN